MIRNQKKLLNKGENPATCIEKNDGDLLNECQARAQELPMSLAWYRRQRLLGEGPSYRKIGPRVFYRRRELREWVERQKKEGGGR